MPERIGYDLGDAWDEPDTGVPPCRFCWREIPCECDEETCMCTCGRCSLDAEAPMADPAIATRVIDRELDR